MQVDLESKPINNGQNFNFVVHVKEFKFNLEPNIKKNNS